MSFPENFVWGAAAASYQVEGAAFEDGRGLSVWDVFSHTPGKVFNNETGDVACDHYHRYVEDVALMKSIGLQAYRFSISWPRVLPEGTGTVNQAGLDFYDRLVDALLEADITPYATLFHWDFPWELYCKGGWLNRDSADWFAEYTELMVKKLGDRVRHWMTLNEPPVFVGLGHEDGTHAPGEQWSRNHLLRIVHHVLLAHGKSVQAIRASSPQPAEVGLAMNTYPVMPQEETPEQITAATAAYWNITEASSVWNASLWLDPMLKGEYPTQALELWEAYIPLHEGDMAQIQQALDFIGLNIYWGGYWDFEAKRPLSLPEGFPRTMMDWEMTPEALYWGPKYIYDRYGLPIYITENGLASMDWVATDGAVHDAGRIDFLRRYLQNFRRAGQDGVDIAGYFQWSILDNFEWERGYRKRFGLVHVDYQTQQRTLKDSALWYRDLIAQNGAALDG